MRLNSFAIVLLLLAGCSDPPLIGGDAAPAGDAGREVDAGPTFDDGGGIGMDGLSIARVVPDHGPFTGGNQVVLRGNGFTDMAQVAFGGRQVQPADHRLIDARRLAVVVPAGEVGPVDVEITVNGETVTLEDGYTYDAIYVEPNSGAVSGGTYVSIVGSGTNFTEGDNVIFGRTDCEDVEVVSATRINCRTPPMSAGTVDVTVVGAEDGSEIIATDAFTYFDSTDPFQGGLGGGPISGSINLSVIDANSGLPVPDAYAIVGEDQTTMHQGLTDALGQITFSGPDLPVPATIHVAAPCNMCACYEKTSVVAFDARDVTVFLVSYPRPGLTLEEQMMCAGGGGGRPRNGAFIEGELVWYGPNEMGPNPWLNVPQPREGWVRVAYVYTTQAALGFGNPDPSLGGANQRVLETPTGVLGYPYSVFARPAGLAVYALAGLEHTATQRFIPYVMGIARNVLAGPGQTVEGVDIVMNIPLDHYLELEVTDLPSEVDTGPDSFRFLANIDLGGEGVIVREVGFQELDVLRAPDASRLLRFVYQPALEGALSDGRYRVQAGWFTGAFDGPPFTDVIERGITSGDETLTIGGFLGIPDATAPAWGEQIPADRVMRWEADGDDPDFHIVLIQGGDGNPAWRAFTPGNVREMPIPDLSTIPGITDITSGFIVWQVYAIRIPGFDFNEFRYSDLNDLFWTGSASNYFTAQR
jgi:hypothetical protein